MALISWTTASETERGQVFFEGELKWEAVDFHLLLRI